MSLVKTLLPVTVTNRWLSVTNNVADASNVFLCTAFQSRRLFSTAVDRDDIGTAMLWIELWQDNITRASL